MRRRELIAFLGAAAATWPLPTRAQQARRTFKIGHLESGSPSSSPDLLAAFQQGLRKLGYVEGENVFIERRYAEGRVERLPQLAAELVRLGVDVIFAIGPPQALAAAKATSTIPIVFVGGGDPVAAGLVKSLARPGGNLTGLTLAEVELAAKRIQLLKEVVPAASRVAILWNPDNPFNKLELNEAGMAGRMLGLTLLPAEIRAPEDLAGAFGAMAGERAEALFVLSSPVTFPNRAQLAELTHQGRLADLGPDSRVRGGRLSRILRSELCRPLPASRDLRGPDPERCEAGGLARSAPHAIAAGVQSEGRQGDRPSGGAGAALPRRRGHRVARLIQLDVRILDDRGPARDLAPHQRQQRLRAAPRLVGNVAAEHQHALARAVVVERLVERVDQPVEDRLRRALGSEQAVPGRRLECGQPGFRGGGHVRHHRVALRRGDCVTLILPGSSCGPPVTISAHM